MPNLYVSAWPDAKTLEREDFDVVVTCCWKEIPEGWKDFIIQHYHYPMSDSSQIPGKIPPEVDEAVRTVLRALTNNKKTLVHCYAGHNRSWLVATLAYATITGLTPKTAYTNVMKIYDGALRNTAFVEYLNDSSHNREWSLREDRVRYVDARGSS